LSIAAPPNRVDVNAGPILDRFAGENWTVLSVRRQGRMLPSSADEARIAGQAKKGGRLPPAPIG